MKHACRCTLIFFNFICILEQKILYSKLYKGPLLTTNLRFKCAFRPGLVKTSAFKNYVYIFFSFLRLLGFKVRTVARGTLSKKICQVHEDDFIIMPLHLNDECYKI